MEGEVAAMIDGLKAGNMSCLMWIHCLLKVKRWCCESTALNMPANLENSAVATVFIPIPKKGNAKECSNYHTIALISQASKVMLKILQDRLQQYVNRELPDVQAGFRKGKGTRDQIANIHWIIKKATEFQKNIYFCLYWLRQSLWLCGWQQTGKFLKKWEHQTTLPISSETCMQDKKHVQEARNN